MLTIQVSVYILEKFISKLFIKISVLCIRRKSIRFIKKGKIYFSSSDFSDIGKKEKRCLYFVLLGRKVRCCVYFITLISNDLVQYCNICDLITAATNYPGMGATLLSL